MGSGSRWRCAGPAEGRNAEGQVGIAETEAAGQAAQLRAERNGWDQVNQALVDTYLRVIRQRAQGLAPRSSPVP